MREPVKRTDGIVVVSLDNKLIGLLGLHCV